MKNCRNSSVAVIGGDQRNGKAGVGVEHLEIGDDLGRSDRCAPRPGNIMREKDQKPEGRHAQGKRK